MDEGSAEVADEAAGAVVKENPCDTVTKLIALAADSNENNARNAAMKACALIRQHDLRIARGGSPVNDVGENAPPSPTWASVMRAVGVGIARAPEAIRFATEIAEGVNRLAKAARGDGIR